MRKPTVRYDYSKLSDPAMLTFARSVETAMLKSTAIFPDPSPSMTTFSSAVHAYAQVLAQAATGNRTSIANKDLLKTELSLLLATLAQYVNSKALGDESKLVCSGFTLRKKKENRSPIEAPRNLQLQPGTNQGEIIVSVDRVPGAFSYLFQITEGPMTPQSVWQTYSYTTRKCRFEGLVSGKLYYFKVQAIAARNQVTVSPIQARMAT
jgi:hypothetical protein